MANSRHDKSEEIRASIRRFMEVRRLQVAPWARRAKLSEGTLRNFLAGTSHTITAESLTKLADAEGVSVQELIGGGETRPAGAGVPTSAIPGAIYTAPDLPILGSARGGLSGHVALNGNELVAFSRTYRPIYLIGVGNAYAINIVGTSMEPALRDGSLAYVDPTKNVEPGDDVVIVQTNGEWFVKQLVRRTAKQVIARQHNPVANVEYPADKVEAVHLIVGSTRVRT